MQRRRIVSSLTPGNRIDVVEQNYDFNLFSPHADYVGVLSTGERHLALRGIITLSNTLREAPRKITSSIICTR